MIGSLGSLVAAAVLAIAAGNGGPAVAGGAASASPVAGPAIKKPAIRKHLIPYPQRRRNEMAAYSKRHYGERTYVLSDPKVIVIHYAVAGSLGSIYNTFASDRPDPEFGELPNVCSQFAVGAKGGIVKFVPANIRCRHTVGLNHVSIGIEHVGFSDGDVLRRKRQFRASLRLTQFLRCRFGIGVKNVIGHNESLSSPFYEELDPDFQGQTHGDFKRSSMRVYRRALRRLGDC
jgi:beta-N-acetylhexosaminidase